jgi:hypothetical protein
MFDSLAAMEVVGRWWNGRRERATRRDIWLTSDGALWTVRARRAGAGGEVTYQFDREYEARAMVDRLKATAPDEWKDLIRLIRREERPPGAP